MRSTFRILFFLKRDKQKSNGKVPLFCRITVDGKEARFGMKTEVDPSLWNVKEGRAVGRSTEAMGINNLLDQAKASLLNTYNDIQASEVEVTAEKVKNLFLGITAKEYTVLTLFQRHNDDVQKLVGISKSKTTWQKYERAKNHLTEFLKLKYRVSDISGSVNLSVSRLIFGSADRDLQDYLG